MSAFDPLQTLGDKGTPLIMKRKLVFSVGVVVAVFGAAALALSGGSSRKVGGKQFAVPAELLFEGTIPWLPVPEGGSFTFLLNPNPNPEQIPPHRVLVQSAKAVCGSDRMSQMVRVACGQDVALGQVAPPFKKLFPLADYAYAWDYYAVASSTAAEGKVERLQVASCSPISPNPARPKGTAICTSVWGVEGLVLSLGFEEHELAQLPSMRARATDMLLSWNVR